MSEATAAWMIASGLGTAIGAPFLLALRRPAPALVDTLTGFTAGIMLAAAIFSLIVPALDRGSVAEVAAGLLAGAAVLAVVDAWLPHLHARLGHPEAHTRLAAEGEPLRRARSGLLVVAALTIHNVPEGLAVGVAFAAGGPELGIPVAVAIGVQNIPEGFVAGVPLVPLVGVWRAVLIAGATGLVEPPAAFLAFAAAGVAGALLPVALAFAAGCMIYVVVDELVPEAQAKGNERLGTFGLFVGFVVMLVLDNALA